VLQAPNLRGGVIVTATTPSGVTASVPVTFVPVPVSVTAVSTPPQNVLPGTPLGPLRVRVLAGDGLGVKGIPVNFAVVSGGGSVTSAQVVTDSGGFAETPATAGTAGANVFSATVAGVAAPALFNVAVLSTAGTQLVFSVPPGGALTGLPFGVVVEIHDAQGALAAAATDAVTIALGANPGSATLGGTLTVNAVAGVAVFGDLTLNQPGTGYTVVATAPGLTPATSPAFDVIAGLTGRRWTNVAGGNWSDPANWSDGIVPGPTDTVYVATDGTYTVTLDVNVQVAMLFLGGASGTQTIAGTSRALQVDSVLSIGPTGQLQMVSGTVGGVAGVVLNQGQLRLQSIEVLSSIFNSTGGQFVARGANLIGPLTNSVEALVRIEGDAFCCAATLTVVSGDVVNLGQLELTAINTNGTTAELVVQNGTLVNAVGGLVAVQQGTGGTRNLNAELDNQGRLEVSQNLAINRASAQHSNSGTIELLTGNVALTQTGTAPSFATSGAVILGAGRTLSVSGGAFDDAGVTPGGLAGLGTLSLTSVTLGLTPDFTHDTLTLSLVNSTVNGPGTLTNAAGRTLTVQSTTLNAPLVNQGVFVARGNTVVAGGLTTTPASTIQVQGDAFCCAATLSVPGGFTNTGLLELTAINTSGTTAEVSVPSGFLVNAASGTVASRVGAGGTRNLLAAINNQGNLVIEHSTTVNAPSADHVNSGTIQVTNTVLTMNQSGTTPTFTTSGGIAFTQGSLQMNGGAFNYTTAGFTGRGGVLFFGATVNLGASLQHVDTMSLYFENTTVNGPGTVTNVGGTKLRVLNTTFNAPLVNQGFLETKGASAITGGLTTAAGTTIEVLGDAFCCAATLTVPGGFTNNGRVNLFAVNTGGTSVTLDVPSGTLVNAAGGTIYSDVGGGSRAIQAQLDNQGMIQVVQDLVIGRASAAHVNTGTIVATANVTITQSGTAPSFTTTGQILVASGFSLMVNGGTFAYANTAAGGLAGKGTMAFNSSTLTLTPALGNDTLALSFTNATVGGLGLLTNAPGRTLVAQNTAINTPFANLGTLVARGTSMLGGSITTGTGSVIRVEGDAACCAATLTVGTAFTNAGLVELTSVNGATSAALVMPTATLTNTGTVTVTPGAGGSRQLDASIVNSGVVTLAHDLTLSRPISSVGAVHWTAGSVAVANGATLDILPDATFDVSSTGQWNGTGLPAAIIIQARASMKVITAGSVAIGPLVAINNSGALDIQAPAVLKVSGDFNNLTGGELLGTGTLDIAGSPKVTNAGITRPGTSPGVLTIAGNWPMGLGTTLHVDIVGLEVGTQYDQLVVTGAVTMGGTIVLTGNGTFVPPPSIPLAILTFGSSSGQPFVVTNVLIGPPRNTTYGPTSLTVNW
jgi:hypothetical protein